MATRLKAKKSADGDVTEEESELAAAVLEQEARLEGLRIAGEELEEHLFWLVLVYWDQYPDQSPVEQKSCICSISLTLAMTS